MDEQHDGNSCDFGCAEDPDFINSDHDFESEQDDIEYDRNVIDGVKIGLDRRQDEVNPERKECNDVEVDELELPSSDELLSQCSSDEGDSYHFPEFNFDQYMKNPQFEVGQIFSSASEFREAMRMYGALNGYKGK
ncbi:Hypothetical predicted protein [Olea europaea subsp. europaea]|uniref:Uncharacterized protein n=1 Tax=Olea europaea subsp. europaea TaxID=158383 RepID=A0A8S0USY9_OLEEU|nr:Hypothetical predicted protein [Olea europaea subsp. europaea]